MSRHPHFGHTRHGLPVHAKVTDHLPEGSAYQRFNKRLALLLTKNVGTMTCFWVFWAMGFTILPSVLHAMGILGARWIGPAIMLGFGFNLLGTWLISTCFQAVLLPGLMVGQNLQNEAADARAAKQFEDTEELLGLAREIRSALSGAPQAGASPIETMSDEEFERQLRDLMRRNPKVLEAFIRAQARRGGNAPLGGAL